MSDQGVYLYAVATGLSAGDLAGVPALAGGAVRVVEHDGLCAVVSDVPLHEFGEEPLRENLERLEWVEETARTHHEVVTAAARAASAAAPVRLVTVYRDDDRVRRLLDERRATFTSALERIDGRGEWGVKVYAAEQDDAEPPESAPVDSAKPGTSYLMRRSAQRRRREDRSRRLAEQAEELHERLAKVAVACRRHPPQDPRLSGRSEPQLLNMAYLVDDVRADRFTGAVEEAAAATTGLRVEVTGPWPAYSFIELDGEVDGAGRDR
ncbi:GvpL/GvpF family gas vesicle protein [Thermomonospora amylolytica]|uniref:GvpL/GvpF family gas vesicle protein n=1 Tax=Thermomonospora amylolytica TaxID=1411117 RepID=UPI000E6C6469|nr:GvpL/GvpF family gas vesicle protein [Thermomonospora amylolytica]